MNTAYTAIILLFAVLPAIGQTATPALEFEVASVKPAPPPSSGAYEQGFRLGRASRGIVIEGKRVTITDNTLKDLVRLAYQVKPYQVTGEKWMETERYDIAATLPSIESAAGAPEMLRNLLASRFHLVVRRESKELPVYALLVGKSGPKLKAAVTGTPSPAAPDAKQMAESEMRARVGTLTGGGALRIRGKEYTIGALADRLTGMLDRPVLDLTGLEGKYDIDLTYSRGDDSDLAPSLFPALQDQLGLKVEARKSPVAVIAIERADKAPTEN